MIDKQRLREAGYVITASARGYRVERCGKVIAAAGIASDAKGPTGPAYWKQVNDNFEIGWLTAAQHYKEVTNA